MNIFKYDTKPREAQNSCEIINEICLGIIYTLLSFQTSISNVKAEKHKEEILHLIKKKKSQNVESLQGWLW